MSDWLPFYCHLQIYSYIKLGPKPKWPQGRSLDNDQGQGQGQGLGYSDEDEDEDGQQV